MKNQEINLTTAQFAAIHEVNPRTLHYYDSVGLFSPERKGENQYRYYTSRQSIDFEYIRMLKELNMSIREIRSYVQEPGPDKFMELANEKINEINREIQRLEKTKEILKGKRDFVFADTREEYGKGCLSFMKKCWYLQRGRILS